MSREHRLAPLHEGKGSFQIQVKTVAQLVGNTSQSIRQAAGPCCYRI